MPTSSTMRTVYDTLKAETAYPVPAATLEKLLSARGLDAQVEATAQVVAGKQYRLAVADLYKWLVYAPNVAQGGQSYTLTDAQREALKTAANAVFKEYAESESANVGVKYGYKGSKL